MFQESTELLIELQRLAACERCAAPAANAGTTAHLEAIMQVAKSLQRIFRLPVPDAPGLSFIGAEVDASAFPVAGAPNLIMSASGKGSNLLQAAQSCVGECVEFLSQLVWGSERFQLGTPEEIATGLDPSSVSQMVAMLGFDSAKPIPAIHWIEASRLLDASTVLIPAGLCFRNIDEPSTPCIKLSSGCGAGSTKELALLHGLLELVERDAIALWWLGGRKCREIPLELIEGVGGAKLLGELRQDRSSRSTWLLDITTDIGIPTIAALSLDRRSGRGLVGGFSAGLTYAEAIRAAILELCQVEVGIHIIELKRRQRGDQALNLVDLKHLGRARDLDARACGALYASEGPNPIVPDNFGADSIEFIARRLHNSDIELYVVDLTRPALGIPVVRVLTVGLQPMPSTFVTPRLARQIAESGGGFGLTSGYAII